ncbi:MAG: hypothetical protein ACM3VZ_09625 [Acidobacteriota bacterium]
MTEELLFRIALAPTAFFIWARYVTWPLFIIGAAALIFFRVRPVAIPIKKLVFVQRSMVAVAVLLSISLVAAYFMIPDTDRQLGVFWFGALLGSLPVLIPAAVAVFLSPMKGLEKAAVTQSLS